MQDNIFQFNPEKNTQLQKEWGFGFDAMIALINQGNVVDIIDHPNQRRYPGQLIYMLDVEGYIYMVPFVMDEEKRFLKTFYASRKATKHYLKEKKDAAES